MTYTNYSFSTVWNANEPDGAKAIRAIEALGFPAVEINFQFTAEKLAQAAAALRTSRIRVSGVHNFCPAPEEAGTGTISPDHFSLAATDEAERKKAVAYTVRSITTAKQLGGAYVVLHSGYVDVESPMRKLVLLAREGKKDTPEFERIRRDMQGGREDSAAIHFDALCTSYRELTPIAKEKGIMLGIENRYYYREMPSPDEIEKLLEYFKGRNIGYWHDIGHACMQEFLGLYPAGAYLERLQHDLLGVHLHDIRNFKDHFMACLGEIDYPLLARFLRKATYTTVEIHGSQTVDDIHTGMQRLLNVLG